jgi:mycothiol synthase
VLHPDGRGEAVLEVHPALGTWQLEAEMIDLAEQRLAAVTADGRRSLRVWVNQHDHRRQALLHERGYTRGEWPEYQRRRLVRMSIPDASVPDGYSIRALGDRDELPARSWLSWGAFHPDEPDDRYEGCDWYLNVQRAPMYRRDLDLVAVAPGGDLAAFCTIWFDDVTRTGAFEPVGTEPAHQRRGLGKALMCEGLRRLRQLGATLAYVGSYGAAAHALYESAGFTEYELSEPWSRAWTRERRES